MDYIQINQAFTATIDLPDSISTDTVKYKIYKAGDGSIFAQGNATYIAGIHWKVTFTPNIQDVFIVEVWNETRAIDVIYSREFQAVSSTTLSQPIEDDSSTPTASELLVLIDKAIRTRLAGGAVQSYAIAGRNLQYMTLTELRQLKNELQQQIAAEGGGARNYVSFTKPR